MAEQPENRKDPQKAAYDAGCKRILAEKVILAWKVRCPLCVTGAGKL